MVALLMGVGLPVVALLVPAFYGPSYEGVPPILIALGVANGFLIVGAPVGAFVMARLSGFKVFAASLVALAVDVALALTLIPVWGVWGAVAANVCAAATQMMLLLVSEVRALGLTWGAVLRDALPALWGRSSRWGRGWWPARVLRFSSRRSSPRLWASPRSSLSSDFCGRA